MIFRIETVAIGDELLCGTIADTNSAYIAQETTALGHRLQKVTVIADDIGTIQATLRERARTCDLLVIFGGLGPTSDDKTVEALCELLQCPPVSHGPSRLNIEAAYQKRGQPLNPHALKQALYPEFTTPLPNSAGMAPGFRAVIDNCICIFLPGVPLEMKAIFQEQVKPTLNSIKGFAQTGVLQKRVWRCLGIFESQLQLEMDPIEKNLGQDAWLGYRTHFPENHLTLYYRGKDLRELESMVSQIDCILDRWCYSRTDDDIESTVFRQLRTQGARVALAESCTGGLVANRLTRNAGASDILWGGIVAYSLPAKKSLMNLAFSRADDAVSESSALQMAESLRSKSDAEYTAAITGYLGPDAGGPDKPAGTIFCCVIDKKGVAWERKVTLNAQQRERTQWGAATHLLDLIRVASR